MIYHFSVEGDTYEELNASAHNECMRFFGRGCYFVTSAVARIESEERNGKGEVVVRVLVADIEAEAAGPLRGGKPTQEAFI
jgi:hypothetical protein